MRTTLTLEPDVAREIKARMAAQKSTMKQVVNDALRRGLAAVDSAPAMKPFRVEPHSFGLRPGIDPDKLNQLVDELEVQEYVAKMKRDKR